MLCAVIVALHEGGRQRDVYERAGEERAVGDDVDFQLLCCVQKRKVVGVFLCKGLRH